MIFLNVYNVHIFVSLRHAQRHGIIPLTELVSSLVSKSLFISFHVYVVKIVVGVGGFEWVWGCGGGWLCECGVVCIRDT